MKTRKISLKTFLAFVFGASVVSVVLVNIGGGPTLSALYSESKLPQANNETTLLQDLNKDCKIVESIRDSDSILLTTGENLTFAMYKYRKAEAFLKVKGQPYHRNEKFPSTVVEVRCHNCFATNKIFLERNCLFVCGSKQSMLQKLLLD